MSYVLLGQVPQAAAAAFNTGNAKADALLAQANIDFARILAPLGPAIDRSSLPEDQKWLLKNQPITFQLQLFRGIENIVAEIISLANVLSNRPMRAIGIPGLNRITVSMAVDWPQDEMIASPTGRHILRMLRIANCWMIFAYQDPLHLAEATVKILAKYSVEGAHILADYMRQGAAAGEVTAQRTIAVGQDLARQGARSIQNAIQFLPAPPQLPSLPSFRPPTFRSPFSGLGFGTGVVEGGTALGVEGGSTAGTMVEKGGEGDAAGKTTGVVLTPPTAAFCGKLLLSLLEGTAAAAITAAPGVAAGAVVGVGAAITGQSTPDQLQNQANAGLPPSQVQAQSQAALDKAKSGSLTPYLVPALGLGALLLVVAVLRKKT